MLSKIGSAIDRLVFDLNLKLPYWLLFPCLFFSLFSHLFWPVWIFLLGIPYWNAWMLYLYFAQTNNPNRKSIYGFKVPVIPFDIEKVYAVNREVLKFLTTFINGKPYEIIQLYFKKDLGLKAALNIPFGKNASTLDIYQEQQGTLKPVIVFIYGAGWNGGDKSLYTPIAKTFCERGYVVVIPDYAHWPKATADEMVNDVEVALRWTLKNIKRYDGDPSNVTVIGHGAGAHLAATAVIKSAITTIETSTRNGAIHHRDSITGTNELRKLKGMILLSGSYDIEQKVLGEKIRGIDELACTSRLFGFTSEQKKSYSPTYLLDPFDKVLAHQLPQAWLLIHGSKDPIIPFESSLNFFNALQRIGIDNLVLDTYPEANHEKLLHDLFLDHFEPLGIFTKIKEFHERVENVKRFKSVVAFDHQDFQR